MKPRDVTWRKAIRRVWTALKTRLRPSHIGRRHRIDVVKGKILSYVARAQRERPAGALFNYSRLVETLDADEQVYLEEALDELVSGGVLDRAVGRFYVLKGGGSTGPLAP